MTKSEIAEKIANKMRKEVSKDTVTEVLEIFGKEVIEAWSKGEDVFIRGFGTFALKVRKPKIARHILKDEPIALPETVKGTLKVCDHASKIINTHFEERKNAVSQMTGGAND